MEALHWWPFLPLTSTLAEGIALIKLNTPLEGLQTNFESLWNNSLITGVTDGAINVLHELNMKNDSKYIPTFVSGDFDSALPEILELYKEKGVEIHLTPDLNKTDFTKCLEIVLEKITSAKLEVHGIFVSTATTGRLDHIFANMNSLFLAHEMTKLPLYLIDAEVTFLLPKGKHVIHLDDKFTGEHCGLIPLGKPCIVSTQGLKWNLHNQLLEFGELVSTSNKVLKDILYFESTESFLFTLELAH